MDECICMKKFDTNPAELVSCSVHPGCSCLETQDINCISCNAITKEQEDSPPDLNCEEDFETDIAEPQQEIVVGKVYLNYLEESYRECFCQYETTVLEEQENEPQQEIAIGNRKVCLPGSQQEAFFPTEPGEEINYQKWLRYFQEKKMKQKDE